MAKQEKTLVELNDAKWHKINEILKPMGLYLQINVAKRGGSRALLIYKKEHETDEDFKRVDTFLVADEYDVDVALTSIKTLLDAMQNKNK